MKRPTIVVLGGSEGGLREGNAALLAAYGYNTFALAYFGIEHLPKELIEIPLDYIEEGLHWLLEQPTVDAAKLAITGVSKGGELALLCASYFSAIKAVIAVVPSGIVYPGISMTIRGKSSWQYKGQPLPFAYNTVHEEVNARIQQARETKTAVAWRDLYLHWAAGATEAEIPVERIQGPVLLLSGGDDQLWPADILSDRVIARLQAKQFTHSYKHISFPKAGHSIGTPGYPTSQSDGQAGWLLLGGTAQANANAQYEAWAHVRTFLQQL